MVNESDEDDDDLEDESETGAMLRPSTERQGKQKFYTSNAKYYSSYCTYSILDPYH